MRRRDEEGCKPIDCCNGDLRGCSLSAGCIRECIQRSTAAAGQFKATRPHYPGGLPRIGDAAAIEYFRQSVLPSRWQHSYLDGRCKKCSIEGRSRKFSEKD